MNKIGKYEFVAEPFHCDFSGRMFLGHLGNQMLNAADFHSTDRGFGMKYLMTINRSWVLSRLAIEMEEMPSQHEHYTIETWVEGAMKFFTSRNFCVSDGNGKVYGYGRSIWAMIDTETRQPTDIYSIDNGAINAWIVDDKPCPIEKGGRVKMSGNDDLVCTIGVNYNARVSFVCVWSRVILRRASRPRCVDASCCLLMDNHRVRYEKAVLPHIDAAHAAIDFDGPVDGMPRFR